MTGLYVAIGILILIAVFLLWIETCNPLNDCDFDFTAHHKSYDERSGKDRRQPRDDREECLWPQRRQIDRRQS